MFSNIRFITTHLDGIDTFAADQVCIPMGGCIGALLGLINESLRNQPEQNEAVGKDRTDPYQTI